MKKKQTLTPLALSGLLAAMAASAPLQGAVEPDPIAAMKDVDAEKGNLNYRLMTSDELLIELDDQGTKLYNSLDGDGKRLALFVASQRCQGSNACKGLNACATDSHECAGKGSCKGTTKCGMSDKNLAVKLAAETMAKKRAATTAPHATTYTAPHTTPSAHKP